MRRVAAALVAATGLLSGCGSVTTDGTKPVALLVSAGGATSNAKAFECTLTSASAVLVFEGNGTTTSGDFTARVKWSSDNPGVLAVSNADLPAASGAGYYASGILVPQQPGLANITAEYLTFKTTISVQVEAITLALTPVIADVAARSQQQFTLTATTDSGLATTLSEGIKWSLDSGVVNASVDGNGLLTANGAADTTVVLHAQPVGCNKQVEQPFKVSPIQSISVVQEQPAGKSLPLGFSDKFQLLANFADSSNPSAASCANSTVANPCLTQQNLTTQMGYAVENPDILATGLSGNSLIVGGLAEGASGITATFAPSDGQAITTPLPTTTVQNLTVSDLQLAPAELQLHFPNTGVLVPTATFSDGVARPVPRSVTWSTSDNTHLGVVTSGEKAGTVVGDNSDYDGQVFAVLSGIARSAQILLFHTSP